MAQDSPVCTWRTVIGLTSIEIIKMMLSEKRSCMAVRLMPPKRETRPWLQGRTEGSCSRIVIHEFCPAGEYCRNDDDGTWISISGNVSTRAFSGSGACAASDVSPLS